MRYETLRTVRQIAASNPAFSESALRWYVFQSKANGLDRAIVRLGRKVLIDEVEFSRWLESKRVAPTEPTPPPRRRAADTIETAAARAESGELKADRQRTAAAKRAAEVPA